MLCVYVVVGYCLNELGEYAVTVLPTAGHAPYFAGSSAQFIAAVVAAEREGPIEHRPDAVRYIQRRRQVSIVCVSVYMI